VVEAGSFSRAASTLSVGQPVLSRLIRRLEEDLQVQLLHRNGRGVRPTEAGERLLEHARSILRGVAQAQADLAARRAAPLGTITIAVPPLLGNALLVDLVRRLKAQYPLVSIRVREAFAAEALEWLAAGTLDIAVLFNPPRLSTLVVEPVLDDQIHLVGTPESLDRPHGTPLPMKMLEHLPLVVSPAPHRLRGLIESAAHEAGVRLKVEVEVTGIHTILELVRARIGFTVLPSVLLQGDIREQRLAAWPIVDPIIATRLHVATSMQRPQTLAVKVALKAIAKILAHHHPAARQRG